MILKKEAGKMSDHEWVKEHISEYHSDDCPPCGTGEGCGTLLIILGIAFVLFRFVLPFFGIEIDFFQMIQDFMHG
jgi:hypothetical protein